MTFWAVSPGHCKTQFNGYRGKKDPLEGARVVVRLLGSERGRLNLVRSGSMRRASSETFPGEGVMSLYGYQMHW